MSGDFTFRLCATSGCELLTPGGHVVAWTVDAAWAAVIVELLNCCHDRIPDSRCCMTTICGSGVAELAEDAALENQP
jgi:hypothetical protein